MSNVIYMHEWVRERLGRHGTASTRRSRLGQVRKGTLTAGSDLSAELRRLLSLE